MSKVTARIVVSDKTPYRSAINRPDPATFPSAAAAGEVGPILFADDFELAFAYGYESADSALASIDNLVDALALLRRAVLDATAPAVAS